MKLLPIAAELLHAGGQTDRQTGMTKLVVIFRNFEKAPDKNSEIALFCYYDLFKSNSSLKNSHSKRTFFCVCAALIRTVCQECTLVGI